MVTYKPNRMNRTICSISYGSWRNKSWCHMMKRLQKNLLPMLNPVLCSYLMEKDIEYFIFMNLTTTALALILVPVMAYIPVKSEELNLNIDENKTDLWYFWYFEIRVAKPKEECVLPMDRPSWPSIFIWARFPLVCHFTKRYFLQLHE